MYNLRPWPQVGDGQHRDSDSILNKIFDLVNISVTVYCKDILGWIELGSI